MIKNNPAEQARGWASLCEDQGAAMLHMRDPERDPLLTQSPLLGISMQASSQSTPKLGRLDLQGPGERQAEEQHISSQLRSQERRPHWFPKERNQKVMHRPNDLRGHFISQHLSPGPCAQTTALLVPLPRESLRGFLFISTPFLPGQRTTLTPKQAPRQVLQGAKECHLIRGKDEKWDEASLLPVSYTLLVEIFWGWGKMRALRLLYNKENLDQKIIFSL